MKKIKYKKIQTEISNDTYISKLASIVEKVKNVTFKVVLEDIKVYEFEDTMLVIMLIKDATDAISALMIGNRDEATKNIVKKLNQGEKYLIKGDISVDAALIHQGLIEMTKNEKIIEELKEKALLVKAIQKL